MKTIVADAEADGLYPTKFYVVSYSEDGVIHSLTDYDAMRAFLTRTDMTLVMHNGYLWDIPQLERVLNIKITAKLIDTLPLSWYLYPEKHVHGLDEWGKQLGIAKPKISNWHDLTLDEYVNRCQEDVKINQRLYEKQLTYLSLLYPDGYNGIVSYLMFKMDCAREQERSRWRLDVEFCKSSLTKLEAEKEPKFNALKAAMPYVEKRVLKEPPAKPFKKDGTLSVEGVKWQKYLSDQGLTKTHRQPIYVVTSVEEPNPNSPEQIKDWLFSLGWEPLTFKFEKEEDGSERKIPQVKLPKVPDLCPSVLELAETTPAIHELAGLSVLNHRIGLLKGFLRDVDDEGFLKARVQGFTNTLRFKHTEIVNLPGVDTPYGKTIRRCLIAREGYELVGSDMVALENKTGDHYIYDLDPGYVIEKNQPGYDPHIEMCVIAELITPEEAEFYKWYQSQH